MPTRYSPTWRVEIGGPGDFDGCETRADFADKILADLVEGFRPVDARDRQGLIELLDRNMRDLTEYIEAIKARPITAVRCDPASTPDWRQLRPHPSTLVDNPAEIRDKLINHKHRRLTNGNGSR